MNPLDSFVDFISSTNEQPLEWSKMARILDQIKGTYPISERLSRRVNEVGSFLHENWAVIGNRSKTLVYRKLKHVSDEARAETGDASQLIVIMPTTLSILAFLETNEDKRTWAIKVPRILLVRAINKVYDLCPNNSRFKRWCKTLSDSKMFSNWDKEPGADQLRILKTLHETRRSIAQAQENNTVNGKAEFLGYLPTEAELLSGSWLAPAFSPATRNAHRRSKQKSTSQTPVAQGTSQPKATTASDSSISGLGAFHRYSTQSSTSWTPIARRRTARPVINHSTTVQAAVQRSFEDLGSIQLPFATNGNFDPSLVPPPPPPQRQSSIHQRLFSDPSSLPRHNVIRFNHQPSFDNSLVEISHQSISQPFPPTYDHDSFNYPPSVYQQSEFEQQPFEGFDHSVESQALSHPPLDNSLNHDNYFDHSHHFPMPYLNAGPSYSHEHAFSSDGRTENVGGVRFPEHDHSVHPHSSSSGHHNPSHALLRPLEYPQM